MIYAWYTILKTRMKLLTGVPIGPSFPFGPGLPSVPGIPGGPGNPTKMNNKTTLVIGNLNFDCQL